jgi:hypothetical protein
MKQNPSKEAISLSESQEIAFMNPRLSILLLRNRHMKRSSAR